MASAFEEAVRASDPSTVLDMIKNSQKVSKVIEWPGKPDVKLTLRLLNVSDTRLAKVENQKEFKADGLDIGVHNLADYREQESAHALWRALYDENGKRIFSSVEHLRGFCTTDELTALCNEYNAFAVENDPNVENLSEEDFGRFVELLKKTPGQIAQKVTSLNLAWRLLHTLVSQQAK